jgi:hypothetical protein
MSKYKKGDQVVFIPLNAPCTVLHVTPYNEDGDKSAQILIQNDVNKDTRTIPVAMQGVLLRGGRPTPKSQVKSILDFFKNKENAQGK